LLFSLSVACLLVSFSFLLRREWPKFRGTLLFPSRNIHHVLFNLLGQSFIYIQKYIIWRSRSAKV
jgi:hypothetical protein